MEFSNLRAATPPAASPCVITVLRNPQSRASRGFAVAMTTEADGTRRTHRGAAVGLNAQGRALALALYGALNDLTRGVEHAVQIHCDHPQLLQELLVVPDAESDPLLAEISLLLGHHEQWNMEREAPQPAADQ